MSSVHRSHPMPFGTRILDDGRVNFRLWAPGADKVELCLQGFAPELKLPMAAEDNGWYGITTGFASSGFYYQYLINGEHYVPDPASRYQPEDVNGSSQVIDPEAWQWRDDDWKSLPWEKVVFYELHVGTFSEEGTFAGVKQHLDHLIELGVTAIQLMSIADFPGRRNWGYDGVLLFAPDSSYGTPDDLKDLIETAHAKGLMIFNDVVYSHFGPEGNYLHLYAPAFFTDRYHTPWGDAVNFKASRHHCVRRFFIHNALYWLEEYHFDGLRLDAVHAIFDDSSPNILEELAEAVRLGPGNDRPVYLVLENDHNAARYLRCEPYAPICHFDAQWNDDIHHVLHLLLTGETGGYYGDYKQQPLTHLGRCLTEGFAYQGEASLYRDGKPRGEPCRDLPLAAFVSFLQNHDQVGNRALGERISNLCAPEALRAATAVLLLTPSPPLLFMGQEWACSQPFTYFVDFPEELGNKVSEGRLREFAEFPAFSSPESRQKIPLPTAAATYQLAKLAWDELSHEPHRQWFEYHRELLRLRNRYIDPKLNGLTGGQADYRLLSDRALTVQWQLNDGSILKLIANLGSEPVSVDFSGGGKLLFSSNAELENTLRQGGMEPWSIFLYLQESEI
ncbi:malto-oligosyltrehalose trehalohydrolase [Methylomonas albis]|uniref:Malto-oligosyltrehalose trehalohydrolase n=1 Tax=Methylomonas albis TaxID=1854563 RepID=A0ABR9D2Q2_9GAMM|nr:malto-oligosyltrehalose trehalohydrolase [Methylomonas albis]MBD9356514.1 malto-oligosyltrehalose trehalohydrolase [Methylomonas albis]